MSLSRADQLACDLLKLIKRVIDENEEIAEACNALAEAHGDRICVAIGIEAEVTKLDHDEDDDEQDERIPYAATETLSLTKRDENFLKALRVTL